MINARRLGFAGAILLAFTIFVITVLSIYTGYGSAFLDVIASVYPGFSVTWQGAFIGLLYGLADGFFGFFVLGWLYNHLP